MKGEYFGVEETHLLLKYFDGGGDCCEVCLDYLEGGMVSCKLSCGIESGFWCGIG